MKEKLNKIGNFVKCEKVKILISQNKELCVTINGFLTQLDNPLMGHIFESGS